MMNSKLSPLFTAVALASAGLLIGVLELGALQAKERAENPPQYVNTANCTKCHSDAATLKKMRLKEGPAGLLFHKAGTLHDTRLVPRNAP